MLSQNGSTELVFIVLAVLGSRCFVEPQWNLTADTNIFVSKNSNNASLPLQWQPTQVSVEQTIWGLCHYRCTTHSLQSPYRPDISRSRDGDVTPVQSEADSNNLEGPATSIFSIQENTTLHPPGDRQLSTKNGNKMEATDRYVNRRLGLDPPHHTS